MNVVLEPWPITTPTTFTFIVSSQPHAHSATAAVALSTSRARQRRSRSRALWRLQTYLQFLWSYCYLCNSVHPKILNILLRSLAVTFSKAKKKLYPAIALANTFSCFANQVHNFRIFSTSSIHHVEKQHRTSTSCFHKSNTKFRWCNNHKSNTNDRPTKKWVHSFTQTNKI